MLPFEFLMLIFVQLDNNSQRDCHLILMLVCLFVIFIDTLFGRTNKQHKTNYITDLYSVIVHLFICLPFQQSMLPFCICNTLQFNKKNLPFFVSRE